MATHSSILAWRIPWTEEPGTQSGHENLHLSKVSPLSGAPTPAPEAKGMGRGQDLRNKLPVSMKVHSKHLNKNTGSRRIMHQNQQSKQ